MLAVGLSRAWACCICRSYISSVGMVHSPSICLDRGVVVLARRYVLSVGLLSLPLVSLERGFVILVFGEY